MISKNTISIDEVIARVKPQLRISNTSEYDLYLTMIISEALRHLDAVSLYVKRQCTLDIVDNKAELPIGFMKLIAMRFIGTTLVNQVINGVMQQVSVPYSQRIYYVDKQFLNDSSIPNSQLLCNFNNTAQIINNYLVFNSDSVLTGTVELAFMGLNVDENGQILIYEEYERALASYACYMFTLAYPNELGVGISDRHYGVWVAQKAWIKGGAFKDQFQQNKLEIAAAICALVSDKTVNWI